MATRANHYAYARAEMDFSFDPATLPIPILFAFEPYPASTSTYRLSAPFTLTGNTLRGNQTIPEDSGPTTMRFCWGTDSNRDGILGISEIVAWDPHPFKVVSQSDYDAAVASLENTRWWEARLQLDVAANLLHAFLVDQGAAGATNVSDTVLTTEPSFAHHVGARFGGITGQSGPINRAVFGSTSTIAQKMLNSAAMMKLMTEEIDTLAPTILADFRSPAMMAKPYTVARSRQSIGFNILEDTDLKLAVGGGGLENYSAVFNVIRDSVLGIKVVDVAVTGTLTDLYDFDMEQSIPIPKFSKDLFQGAMIQAGFGTLGAAGHLFKTETTVNGTLPIGIIIA